MRVSNRTMYHAQIYGSCIEAIISWIQVIVLTCNVTIPFPQCTKDKLQKSAHFHVQSEVFLLFSADTHMASGAFRDLFENYTIFCAACFLQNTFSNLKPGEQV